jgi:hypothetical protein
MYGRINAIVDLMVGHELIHKMTLVGSYYRKTFGPNSDIDIVIYVDNVNIYYPSTFGVCGKRVSIKFRQYTEPLMNDVSIESYKKGRRIFNLGYVDWFTGEAVPPTNDDYDFTPYRQSMSYAVMKYKKSPIPTRQSIKTKLEEV